MIQNNANIDCSYSKATRVLQSSKERIHNIELEVVDYIASILEVDNHHFEGDSHKHTQTYIRMQSRNHTHTHTLYL